MVDNVGLVSLIPFSDRIESIHVDRDFEVVLLLLIDIHDDVAIVTSFMSFLEACGRSVQVVISVK